MIDYVVLVLVVYAQSFGAHQVRQMVGILDQKWFVFGIYLVNKTQASTI